MRTSHVETKDPGRRQFKTASGLLFAQGLTLATALLANVIMARALGAAGRGEVALVLQASYIATAVVLLGRDRAYPAVVPAERSLGVALDNQVVLFKRPAVLAVLTGSAFGWIAFDTWEMRGVAATAFAALVLGGAAHRLVRAAAITVGRTSGLLCLTVVGQFLLLLGLLGLWAGNIQDSGAWMGLYGLAVLVPLVYMHLTRARQGPRDMHLVSKAGLRLLPASVGEMLIMRFERVLIPIFASYASLGVYVVVATVTELAAWPMQQYADSKLPFWRDRGFTRRGVIAEIAKGAGFTTAVAVAAASALWWLLDPVFGAEFVSGRQLIAPLAGAAVAASVHRLVYNLVAVVQDDALNRMLTCTSLGGALVAYPFATWQWGAYGAAWASCAVVSAAALLTLAQLLSRTPARLMRTNGWEFMGDGATSSRRSGW